MKLLRVLFTGLLMLPVFISQAQEESGPEDVGMLVEETMTETVLTDEGTQTLLLDNSRSKIGRDFYDAFFRQYADLPKSVGPVAPADTTKKVTPNVELDLNAFIVTIDELPTFGSGAAIISVNLNDQLIWQNYVQIRQDLIEEYAAEAAGLINQYVLYYKEIQQQLESEDQKGSGIF